MRKKVSNLIGTISFLLALSALVIPWILRIPGPSIRVEGFLFCLWYVYGSLSFYILVIIGFFTGIIGWKSRFGKVGFSISLIIFGLSGRFWW